MPKNNWTLKVIGLPESVALHDRLNVVIIQWGHMPIQVGYILLLKTIYCVMIV